MMISCTVQANLEADQYGSMDVARQIWAAILQVSALNEAGAASTCYSLYP